MKFFSFDPPYCIGEKKVKSTKNHIWVPLHSEKSISYLFRTLRNWKIFEKNFEIFENFGLLMSYIGFFKFSPKTFSESLETKYHLILYTANIATAEICHLLVWAGVRTPPPTRLFTTEKLIFSLWNKVFWLSFASLWEVLGLSSLAKRIQKTLFHKEKISFSVVKESCRGGGSEPPPPTSIWQILLLLLLFVERLDEIS